VDVVVDGNDGGCLPRLSSAQVTKDIDLLLWAFRLQLIRRYVGQPYWDTETEAAKYADILEPGYRLETVAEHSWRLADSVVLLAPNFPYLNRGRAVELAVLHDKMEIAIGDLNPLGRDGTGRNGHAFNQKKQEIKDARELNAIERYTARLRPDVARLHRALLLEALECRTPEARFVKALDKMQALAFILLKKQGSVEDKHLAFLVRFTEKNDRYFPPLRRHSQELLRRIFRAAARERGVGIATLRHSTGLTREPATEQMVLFHEAGQAEEAAEQARLPVSAEPATDPESHLNLLPKSTRLALALKEVAERPAARTGLEAYRQVSDAINRVEDEHCGVDHWFPPRHVGPGVRTTRMYPVAPESIYPVPDSAGVDLLATVHEGVFVSRHGAIEVQNKDPSDLFGERQPFYARGDRVLFRKADFAGHHVWHEKNRH